MAYKPIRMDTINQIKNLKNEGKGIKATSRILKISKNTVKKYLKIINDQDLEAPLKSELIYSDHHIHHSINKEQLFELFPELCKKLSKVGVTRQHIWEDYIAQHPLGYSYGEFCRQLKTYKAICNATLNLDHKPGEVMQVDFAGKSLFYYDKQTGKALKTQVLICSLPYSKMLFVIALASQKTHDFIEGIVKALEFFGGSPKVILSDNLKAYVTKSDRYSPSFSHLTAQLGAHYHIELDATRVASPKDKATVERNVTLAYQNIYAFMHDDKPNNLAELNSLLFHHLTKYNDKVSDGLGMSRKHYFEQLEKPCLRCLPAKSFDVFKSTNAIVQRNYHVFLGQDNHYYSVPYQYIGQQTQIVYNQSDIEVFIGVKRIAFHVRNKEKGMTTIPEHRPEKHNSYLLYLSNTPEDYIEKARLIGENTQWAMTTIMQQNADNPRYHKLAEGVLKLARVYSVQRLEQICTYIRSFNTVSLESLRNIIASNIDMHIENQQPDFIIPTHENIRGASYFN